MKKLISLFLLSFTLVACHSPAEKTLENAVTAIDVQDKEALKKELASHLFTQYYYTTNDSMSYYKKVQEKYEGFELENLKEDTSYVTGKDQMFMIGLITAEERNCDSERVPLKNVKFICDRSDNKYGYDNCKIYSLSRVAAAKRSVSRSSSEASNSTDSHIDDLDEL